MIEWIDRSVIRWINRLILVHMFLCVAAFFMVCYSLFAIWDFAGSAFEPHLLMNEAEVLDLPLVNRLGENFIQEESLYECFVQFPEGV